MDKNAPAQKGDKKCPEYLAGPEVLLSDLLYTVMQ